MINRLRYFYKKQKLAIALARFDLLFLLNGLSSFQSVIKPALLFVKPSSLPIPHRIQNFLLSRKGFVPDILASELSVLALSKGTLFFNLSGEDKSFGAGVQAIRESFELIDQDFYCRLFAEIIRKDFSAFPEAMTVFETRFHLAQDMRLYAAELDEIMSLSADSPVALRLAVDWVKTSAETLYVDSPDGFNLATNLSLIQQKNLAEYFAYLLFEKSVFVADWESVAVDSSHKVALLEFDKIYQVTAQDTLAALADNQLAQTLLQLKLHHAMLLLKQYCPEVNLAKIFKPYQDSFQQKMLFVKPESQLMKQLSELGYGFLLPSQAKASKSFALRLLPPKNKETVFLFNKAGLLYWGPLIITAIVVFILFRF